MRNPHPQAVADWITSNRHLLGSGANQFDNLILQSRLRDFWEEHAEKHALFRPTVPLSVPSVATFPCDRSVTAVALDPQRGLVVTGDDSGRVRVWQLPGSDGAGAQEVTGLDWKCDGSVWAVALDPQRGLVVTGDSSGWVRVWNLDANQGGSEDKYWFHHADSLRFVGYHRASQALVSVSTRQIVVQDAEGAFTEWVTDSSVWVAAMFPDGDMVLGFLDGRVVPMRALWPGWKAFREAGSGNSVL